MRIAVIGATGKAGNSSSKKQSTVPTKSPQLADALTQIPQHNTRLSRTLPISPQQISKPLTWSFPP